jgi:glycosyltransferase involved in cell wall biosynthesis
MKVAILGTRGVPPKYGGFETLADELSRGLALRGHDVVVYCRPGYGYPKRATLAKGLTAVRTPSIKSKFFESLTAGVTSALHASFVERPDVVVFCNPSNIWALKLLRLFRIPGVLHMAGLEYRRVKWRGIGASVLRAATHSAVRSPIDLMTDNDAVADWYRETFNRELHVIKYGANAPTRNDEFVAEFGLTHKGYDLVVARWDADNHVAEAIEAHAFSGIDTPLVVVGFTDKVDEYGARIRAALANNPRAISLGSVWDQDKLAALFAGARVYVHGHSAGGTNPALLLGATSGAEVFAHGNPFNREVVGDNAWLWMTVAELAELFRAFTKSSTRKAKALESDVSARYTWEGVVSDYEVLLESIVRRK